MMDLKNNEEQIFPQKQNLNTESLPDKNTEKKDNLFSFSILLKDSGLQALKAVKWLGLTFFFSLVLNIAFLTMAFVFRESTTTDYVTINLLVGLLFTLLALYATYRYVLIDALSVAYKYLTPLFKKVCTKIIDMVVAGGNKLTKSDIEKKLNVGSLMIEIYGKKAPKYVQKGLLFILGRIPFNNFLVNMQYDLSQKKDNASLSEILYKQMDSFIVNSIFNENTMKGTLWVFLLSATVQTTLIWLY